MPKLASILSAGVLAGVTLGVFSIQSGEGAEGTLKEFHQLLMNQKYDAARELMVVPLSPPEMAAQMQLVQAADNLIRQNRASLEILAKESDRNTAIVQVQYVLPNQVRVPGAFVLQYTRNRWRIDAAGTLGLFLQPTRSG